MAKATGKDPTQNMYALLLQQDLDELSQSKKTPANQDPSDSKPPGYIPTPAERKKKEEEKKLLADKEKEKKNTQKAETTDATTKPKPEKLSREQWDIENKKKKLNQSNTLQEAPVQDNKPPQTTDGFQPARPKPQQQFQGQNTEGFQNRGGRGGRGRGGRNAGGRDGEGGQGQYQGYQGGRGGEGRGGEGRGGEGRGGEGRRGGRGPRRGRGGRNGNRNPDDQPRYQENKNRDVNQRGEDLTGERKQRKRQYGDKKSGGYVKEFSNNNVGQSFPKIEQEAPTEWTSTAPSTEPLDASAEGWGDNNAAAAAAAAELTTDTTAEWDAINQGTTETAPAKPPQAPEHKEHREKEPPTKSLDEFLAEQKNKQTELVALLEKNAISAPVPRTLEKEESGGRYIDVKKLEDSHPKKKDEQPKAAKPVKTTKPQPKQLPLENFFKFEANRGPRRFNQDHDFSAPPPTDGDQPPNTEGGENNNTSGRRPRRGRGGQGRGGGGRNTGGRRFNNTSGRGNRGNAGISTNAGNILPKPEEWPDLI